MPLSEEHNKIKEQKKAEFSERLATLTAARDRIIDAQKLDVQKLQDEIDELTVLSSALDSIDQVTTLTDQVATLTENMVDGKNAVPITPLVVADSSLAEEP